MTATYLGDLSVGQRDAFGTYEVSKEEIIEFGEKYDPQPMHVDEESAEASLFGELVASGWHTCGMTMRLLVEHTLADSGAMGSPGVDDLRWHKPVRPGDELSVETEILDIRPETNHNNRGHVIVAVDTLNQDDEVVMSMEATVIWKRRRAD